MVIQMSKKCPECGDEVPIQAHFCPNCGYDFFEDEQARPSAAKNDGIFSNGKIFLVLIAIVIIAGAGVLLSIGLGGNGGNDSSTVEDIEMTITEVSGYSFDYDNKTSYSLSTHAFFTKLPSNFEGYIVKTTYYDNNGTRLGQEVDSLSNIYSKEYSDYPSTFAFFDTYKKPDPDHITVEVEKSGKTVKNYTYEIDRSDIEFLD